MLFRIEDKRKHNKENLARKNAINVFSQNNIFEI